MKLVKFLQKLNREQVTIELKNGTVISGTVVGVDATMNAHLKKAKLTARGKNPVSYATLSVRGSTVRDWILPDGLNLDALLVEDAPKVRESLLFTCIVFTARLILYSRLSLNSHASFSFRMCKKPLRWVQEEWEEAEAVEEEEGCVGGEAGGPGEDRCALVLARNVQVLGDIEPSDGYDLCLKQ